MARTSTHWPDYYSVLWSWLGGRASQNERCRYCLPAISLASLLTLCTAMTDCLQRLRAFPASKVKVHNTHNEQTAPTMQTHNTTTATSNTSCLFSCWNTTLRLSKRVGVANRQGEWAGRREGWGGRGEVEENEWGYDPKVQTHRLLILGTLSWPLANSYTTLTE